MFLFDVLTILTGLQLTAISTGPQLLVFNKRSHSKLWIRWMRTLLSDQRNRNFVADEMLSASDHFKISKTINVSIHSKPNIFQNSQTIKYKLKFWKHEKHCPVKVCFRGVQLMQSGIFWTLERVDGRLPSTEGERCCEGIISYPNLLTKSPSGDHSWCPGTVGLPALHYFQFCKEKTDYKMHFLIEYTKISACDTKNN